MSNSIIILYINNTISDNNAHESFHQLVGVGDCDNWTLHFAMGEGNGEVSFTGGCYGGKCIYNCSDDGITRLTIGGRKKNTKNKIKIWYVTF